MYQSNVSQAELEALVDNEQARLARATGALDLRSELEHHVWPIVKEIVARLDSASDDACIPGELAAQILAFMAQLIDIARKSTTPERLQELVGAADYLAGELLQYVDDEEWAALTQDLVQPPAAEPASASELPTDAEPAITTAATTEPSAASPEIAS